jgi:hypothetical protein
MGPGPAKLSSESFGFIFLSKNQTSKISRPKFLVKNIAKIAKNCKKLQACPNPLEFARPTKKTLRFQTITTSRKYKPQ